MKLSAISKTFLAPLVIMGAVSCSSDNRPTVDRIEPAKDNAIKYLTAEELLKFEKLEPRYNVYNLRSYSPIIAYWDSIITTNAIKQAYTDGQQKILDSIAGKQYENKYQEIASDSRYLSDENKLQSLKTEAAKFYNAEEFIELRSNQPKANPNIIENSDPQILHYWNTIARAGAARKAYADGANTERAKLNQ